MHYHEIKRLKKKKDCGIVSLLLFLASATSSLVKELRGF